MNYLYKLLDETTKRELVDRHRISLSRPINEFKSEGVGFRFFRDLEKMLYDVKNYKELKATESILAKTKE